MNDDRLAQARAIVLPPNHPQRNDLNNEVHARPPEALKAPVRISYLALVPDGATAGSGIEPIRDLARRHGAPEPSDGLNHYSADFGTFRVKWERHTEYTRYTFIVQGVPGDPFVQTAIGAVPHEWIASLPGKVLVASHAVLLAMPAGDLDPEQVATRYFNGSVLIGSSISDGAAAAFTDFRFHADGFTRHVLLDRGMTPRQSGRSVQRLLEIDTYRMLSLLALPVARDLTPFLAATERELAEITSSMVGAGEADEPVLLDRLTRLEAQIEKERSTNSYRFSASVAYYDLVTQRIQDLREQRIPGLQTFEEFTARRLAPAMSTCRAVARRQDQLSGRLSQATQLLSTRVDITRERQNQAVLESMNRRAKQQLRLQQTVEGLSIAAITYYIVGLVSYAAKAANSAGAAINPDVVTGLSIPFVVGVVAYGLRHVRRAILPGSKSSLGRTKE